jgi:hypothetical protein
LEDESSDSLRSKASTSDGIDAGASSRSLLRGAIATGSTCAMSPNKRVYCGAASPQIPTTSDLLSRALGRKVRRSHSVAGIIERCIALVTSVCGGGRPALTRSRLPAGSGGTRAEWISGDLNAQPHPVRMSLPHPLIRALRIKTSAPPHRRNKKLPCRIFPASRVQRGFVLEHDDVAPSRKLRGRCLEPRR